MTSDYYDYTLLIITDFLIIYRDNTLYYIIYLIIYRDNTNWLKGLCFHCESVFEMLSDNIVVIKL
jgi:hypothetical protein